NSISYKSRVHIKDIQDFYTIKSGVIVAIHQRGLLPLLKYDGITLTTGRASNVAISKRVYQKLPGPYSSCRADPATPQPYDSDYYKITVNVSLYYQNLCFEICLQYKYIIPMCNCSDPSIPPVKKFFFSFLSLN